MTLRDLLTQAEAHLRGASDTPQLDAQLLLCHLLNRPRSWLYTHDTDPVPDELTESYMRLIQRRAAGEPVAYLTGEQDFYGLTLKITPDVLIPRPETELLVDLSLKIAENPDFSGLSRHGAGGEKTDLQNFRGTPFSVVDLGTGSGAIAIALKHQRPHWQVAAADISEPALALARENARRHHAEIDFRLGSWLTPFAGERFHLIVSNPPYIDPDDPHLNGSIRFEPRAALVAESAGLAELAAIIEQAPNHLHAGGWLLLEHGWDQGEAVRELLERRGFAKVATHRDLAGHERVSIGQWLN